MTIYALKDPKGKLCLDFLSSHRPDMEFEAQRTADAQINLSWREGSKLGWRIVKVRVVEVCK